MYNQSGISARQFRKSPEFWVGLPPCRVYRSFHLCRFNHVPVRYNSRPLSRWHRPLRTMINYPYHSGEEGLITYKRID